MGLRESRRNNRRQRRGRFFRGLLVTATLCALGVVAYLVGNNLAEREVSRLRAANVELGERLADQSQRGNRLQAIADTAQSRERQWRSRYSQEVPTGAIKVLVSQIQTHLANGADPQRIELFVKAAARPPVCDNTPTTKRFLVRTRLYAGPNDSVNFAGNALTVTARGEAALSIDGNPKLGLTRQSRSLLWSPRLAATTAKRPGRCRCTTPLSGVAMNTVSAWSMETAAGLSQ